MEYYIDLDSGGFTMDEFQEIKLCLETLLSIISGTQALNRDIGIDIEKIVGYPYEIAKNMLSLEIMEKVETYEPRVTVESIDFKGNMEGLLIPIIHFRKSGGAGMSVVTENFPDISFIDDATVERPESDDC